MGLHNNGLGLRRGPGVSTLGVIGGLAVLLVMAAVACDDAEPANISEPAVPYPESTNAVTLMSTPPPALPLANTFAPVPTAKPVAEDEANPAVELDRAALVALYNTTDGLNWTNHMNWLSSQPIGTWYGVTSDRAGRVTHLELYENGLSGQILPDLGSLDHLQLLDLSWNRLNGQIPAELGNLYNLRRLYLEGNLLSGQAPPELGNLHNLTVLHLYGNRLSGRVPPELSNLDNLNVLHLYGNRLSGRVPQDLLSGIESLTWLSLDGNRLTGCVPSALGDRLIGPRGHMRGLPFCDEVPPPRPCKAGMVLKSGEYCTMDTRPWDSSWHPAWPYQLEVQEDFACLVGVCSTREFLRGGFSASKNSDKSWTVHRAPLGTAPPLTPTPSLDSNFGGLSMGPNDNSRINIYMVNPSQEEAEALAEQQLEPFVWPNIREVRTFKVKYSKIQLDSWSRILNGYLGGPEFPDMTGGGVRISENKVSLGVECGAALERVETLIRERMGLHNIPQDAVIFEVRHPGRLLLKPGPPYIFECLPPEVLEPATGLASPGFGGLYVEADTIYVYLLEPSSSLAMELALAYFGRKIVEEKGEVRAVQGQFTWEQLLGWYKLLLDGSWWEIRGTWLCDMDSTLNRITIEVQRNVNPNVVEEVEEWLSDVGVPKEAVTFIRRPQPRLHSTP